ncbi:MAG TPA: gliding motility-associated C-terminal domain-containing protein [Adhaeribacter sp.]|nr:gliding motility-associated C-terminal domain-containing protein [Adhaeribacter sp.]
MQDKDFDRFMQQSLDSFPEPDYNPADWDKLEDRLHDLNAAQPQPSAGSGVAGTSFAKLGFVASAILVTALNVAVFTKPDLFKNATETASKTEVAQPQTAYFLPGDNEPAAIVPTPEEAATGASQDLPLARLATTGTQLETATATSADTPEQANVLNLPATPERTVEKAVSKDTKTAGTTRTSSAARPAAVKPSAGTATRPAVASLASPLGSTANTITSPAGLSGGKPAGVAASACTGNNKPVISLALAGNDTVRDGRLAMRACQTLTARFFTSDKDADKVTVTSNISSVLPGAALFSDKADQPGLMLHWTAKPEMARTEPYEFTLWLTDSGCPDAKPRAVKYALSIAPAFNLAITGNTAVKRGGSTTLEVSGAPAGATYRWLAQGETISSKESIGLQPGQTTTYYLQVNTPEGCQVTDSVKVLVTEPEAETLAANKGIPNIFTPNNDGVNDYFVVDLPEAGAYRLEIFNRWGKRIYENNNYDNKWDARDTASGTYYYVITTTEKKTYKGWVEVIK